MVLRLKWAVVFCLLSSSSAFSKPTKSSVQFEKKKIELSYKKNTRIITVEMAETPEQQEQGLMFREKLAPNEGMLFVFSEERILAFWMKNTLINLDIGYFDKNKKLIDIQRMTATSMMQKDFPSYPSKVPALYALEMSDGWFKKNQFPEGTSLKIIAGP